MTKHTHRAIPGKSIDRGYHGTIPGATENRAAHGNICRTDYCRCGALRNSNINQQHIERGPWLESAADSDFAS